MRVGTELGKREPSLVTNGADELDYLFCRLARFKAIFSNLLLVWLLSKSDLVKVAKVKDHRESKPLVQSRIVTAQSSNLFLLKCFSVTKVRQRLRM